MTIIKVMSKRPPFDLVYADEVKRHLQAIEAEYHPVIRETIESHLIHEPDVETRNRKLLKRPIAFGADWELRLRPDNCCRVFYQVDAEQRLVKILTLGVKERSRLFFG